MPIRLTADTGAQVTACNVDKLPMLGLRKKDLLSTTVGLECANKEYANVLVFVGKAVAEDDSGNNITVLSLVNVMKHSGDLQDTDLQQDLLDEQDLGLDKCLRIATARETAKRSQDTIIPPTQAFDKLSAT